MSEDIESRLVVVPAFKTPDGQIFWIKEQAIAWIQAVDYEADANAFLRALRTAVDDITKTTATHLTNKQLLIVFMKWKATGAISLQDQQ